MIDWYLYIIRCHNGNLYTGITTDIERRFAEHRSGSKKGAKCLKGKQPLKIVFRRKIGSRSEALKLEIKIKKLPKKSKEELLTNNKFEDLFINS